MQKMDQNGFGVVGFILVIVAVSFIGVAGYGVIKSNDSKNAITAPLTSPEENLSEPNVEAQEEVAKQETIKVGKSVKNDLGFTVTVDEIIRNYPSEDVREGEEAILLKVTVATDGKYSGTPGESNMRIVVDGEELRTSYLINDDDLEAAGYNVLGYDEKPKEGSSVSGHYPYVIPSDFENIKFRLSQSTTKVLGGEEVPANNFDVDIL